MPTAAANAPLTLTLNGQLYVASVAGVGRTEAAGRAVAGTFRRDRLGVRFADRSGAPFAYVKFASGEGWFVSCSRHEGRVRYMFGLSDRDAKRLGFDPAAPEACRRERETAADLRRQMAAIPHASVA